VLGLVDEERYLELFDFLAERRHGELFPFVERLLDEGYDLVEFYHGLVDVLRLCLRLRLGGSVGVGDLPEHLREAYQERASAFSPGDLMRMLALASELESTGSLRRSGHPRLLVEMLLLRLSYLDRTVELEALLRGLGGAPAPADPRDGAAAVRRPARPGVEAPPPPATPEPPAEGAAPEPDAWPVTPGARITQDEVRRGRLRELVAKEPALGRAVEALDLELLE
jgi:DNA polymerase III gamma/tau subunit